MKTKTFEVGGIKSTDGDELEPGQFWAYASVFGNKDSYGDVVQPGAFTKTLEEWAAKGQPIPLLWGHNTADPDYNIGHVVKVEQDEIGLKVLCQIDTESTKGPQVYRLLKGGRVNQMSFMYDVLDGEYVEPVVDGKASYKDAYYSLKELKLYEVSVVHIGANPETEITEVKSLADELRRKAGRALSTKNEESLRETAVHLESALAAIKSVLPDDEDEPEDEDEDENEDEKGKDAPVGMTKGAAEVLLLSL